MALTNTFVQGSVGTTDRVANIHPESWNTTPYVQLAYEQFPMMTLLDEMAKGESTIRSRIHHWWNEGFNAYYGSILDVYTNASLVTAYSSGGVVGSVLYFAVTAQHAAQIRENDTIVINNTTNNTILLAEVVGTNIGSDTTSYFAGKLITADGGSALALTTLSWGLASDAQSEGSELPVGVTFDPTEYSNITSIFMEAVEHTGSEMQEMERIDGTKVQRDVKASIERFKRKQEWAYLFSKYQVGTGANGKRKSRMQGAYWALQDKAPNNIVDWRTAANYSGTWLSSGLNWFKRIVLSASQYAGPGPLIGFCGAEAWQAFNDSVEDRGYFNLKERQNGFGIQIKTLYGLVKDVHLTLSPSMSTRGFSNSLFLTQKGLIRKKVFRKMRFIKPRERDEDGYIFVDGKKQGWMEEATAEYHNMDSQYWLDGIGLDHS